jgi:hypothetical protein
MAPDIFDLLATACFSLAILHTFLVSIFQRWAGRFEPGSVGENFFHLLGEIEVVFGLWSAVYLLLLATFKGTPFATQTLESSNFTEPAFVFVILVICATRPILWSATQAIDGVARLLPLPRPLGFYFSCLTIGPLLGSFITEPAAMTVTALILLRRLYQQPQVSTRLKYATLALLFVNISIGGTLTPYSAPPVLMVANLWGWDLGFMLKAFGWKAAIAVVLSTSLTLFRFGREIQQISFASTDDEKKRGAPPLWVPLIHLGFLVLVIITAHSPIVFFAVFLFFLGLVSVTREYHEEIRLREGLLVAFFLGGLVVLGKPQSWWLEPLISKLEPLALFLGTTALTAITDNAALTYLGTQVPALSEAARFALVAGAVTGGGLTVIANAPNPAGFGILNPAFGEEGISPALLFRAALLPTLIAGICFWLL